MTTVRWRTGRLAPASRPPPAAAVSRNRPLLAAIVLALTAAVCAAVAVRSAGTPLRAITWGGLAMAAYGSCIICVLAVARGPGQGLGAWKIGPWMMAWCAASYGFATLTWSQHQPGPDTQIEPSSVLRALWLVAAATTVWLAGYAVAPMPRWASKGRLVAALRKRFTGQVNGNAAWALYGIGGAARLASALTTGHLGYIGDPASAVSSATAYGQVLATMTLCAPLGVATAALRSCREQQGRATLAALFLCEVAFAAVSGDKQNFAIAALAVVLPFSAERRRLPWRLLAVAALVFLTAVIPFTQAYRTAARAGSLTPGQAVSMAPSILGRALVSQGGAAGSLATSVTYLLQRNQDIDGPAIIVQRTPGQVPFASPADLVTAPLASLVPRALWPSKPILATGYQFGQDYYGLPATVYSATTITPIGDLYRHGGWLVVLAGMFLLGGLVRVLDDTLDIRANPHAVFLVLLLFPGLVMAELDWVSLISDIPAQVLVWAFAVWIAFRRQPPVIPGDGGRLQV